MRARDSSTVPGVVLKEAMDFGGALERVILLHFHKRYINRELTKNVSVITIPSLEPKGAFRFAASIFASYFISLPLLMTISLKHNINLFRADDPLMTGLPCVIISKILRLRCMVSMYGDVEEVIMYKIGREKKIVSLLLPIVRQVLKYVINNSFACIVVSKSLAEIAKRYGANRVWITYPNIDLSLFNSLGKARQNKVFTVLFVGRLEPEKGPLNVLEVAQLLTDIEFVIAGHGSLREKMERTIKEKKMTNVKLIGIVNHSDLPEVYKSVDVLLLPSFSEGVPIVMLEAMASELPVIVSKVGAVGEILGDQNGGFTVMPGDIRDIVSKIEILVKDEKLREILGRKGRRNVSSRFSNFIPSQLDFYKNIMAEKFG